jgi:2-methylcitrate dehydratase PrpD
MNPSSSMPAASPAQQGRQEREARAHGQSAATGGAGPSAVERLAGWCCALKYDDIPAAVLAVAVDCLIDTVGVAIAGSTTAVAAAARGLETEGAGRGRAVVLGATGSSGPGGAGGVRTGDIDGIGDVDNTGVAAGRPGLGAAGAAFVNGVAAHALDFDDNCYAGFVHGSAIIVPAALAVAQQTGASGRQLLTALVAGAECEYALGIATRSLLYERGWWTTGVLGPVGACAAAISLLGLDAGQAGAALGLVIAGAGGGKAAFGTDAKALLAGRATQAGVVAAMLAGRGVSGPLDAIEHRRGFAALFNDAVFDGEAIDALGRRWHLLDPGIDIKRIPVCLSSHAAVDALLDLADLHRLDIEAIERIECDVPEIVRANLVHDRPRSRQEAQFSMPFTLAAALVFGDLLLEHLDAAVIAETRVAAQMEKVSMVTGKRWSDPDMLARAPEGACVRVTMRDGRRFEMFCAAARGTAARGLSAAEIETKFLRCAGLALDAGHARALLARLVGVAGAATVGELLDAY